jgi:hypothetical protein
MPRIGSHAGVTPVLKCGTVTYDLPKMVSVSRAA